MQMFSRTYFLSTNALLIQRIQNKLQTLLISWLLNSLVSGFLISWFLVLMVESKHIPTADDVVKLWCHEEARVFRDRLIDEDDRVLFNSIVQGLMKQNLERDWEPDQFKDILYGDYLTRRSSCTEHTRIRADTQARTKAVQGTFRGFSFSVEDKT